MSGLGIAPEETCIIVRDTLQLIRATKVVKKAGLSYQELDADSPAEPGAIAVSTMHLAKGLEFRAVAVMACDDDIIPLQSRLEDAGEDSDLRAVYETERHLLYVACTRARDYLLVTSGGDASEFLDDLKGTGSMK